MGCLPPSVRYSAGNTLASKNSKGTRRGLQRLLGAAMPRHLMKKCAGVALINDAPGLKVAPGMRDHITKRQSA
jgi:hypothetical protein